jgi:response regulator RpfG family c-di-GMP phosphodiesterase
MKNKYGSDYPKHYNNYVVESYVSNSKYTKNIDSDYTFQTIPIYIPTEVKENILNKQKEDIKESIFYFDQEEGMRNYYKRDIKVKGYSLLEIDRLDKVLNYLELHKCKLFVTDLTSPGLVDSFQVVKTIRVILKLDIPVIGLTNFVSPSIIREAFHLGFNDYLIKTEITSKDIRRVIRKYI